MKVFHDIQDVFKAIENENYVVLRGFDEVFGNCISDIDILCENKLKIIDILGLQPVTDNKFCYYVTTEKDNIYIDLRYIGDGYYCRKWEKDILSSKVMDTLFYRPNECEYAYSYYYHILFHKTCIDEKHDAINVDNFKKIGINNINETLLFDYMKDKGYLPSIPKDKALPIKFRKRLIIKALIRIMA